MASIREQTRRDFLRAVGTGVPTLNLVLHGSAVGSTQASAAASLPASPKFTPIDLGPHFNVTPTQFGPRPQARELGSGLSRDGLIRTPAGRQSLRGIPFLLGPEGVEVKRWLLLSTSSQIAGTRKTEIHLGRQASFLCLAAFCGWDPNEAPPIDAGPEDVEKVGQRLAQAVLVYEDGSEYALPLRRRFEVNAPSTEWGHLSFASLTHEKDAPTQLTDPLRNAMHWGRLQTAELDENYPSGPDGRAEPIVWVSALPNPQPDRPLKSLRLEAMSDDLLVVCGLTLFDGHENPLRFERLALYRITLPEAIGDVQRWKVEVDLGIVARTYALGEFQPEAWLSSPEAGLGERSQPGPEDRFLYAEVTASREATLWLLDSKSGKRYAFDLGPVAGGKEASAGDAEAARVEVLHGEKVWLHGEVVDASTGRPTPVRLAFRSEQGRYIPPYGHRAEINDAWFEDYGADVKVRDTSFAYLDGTFQAELPVGDVYVEITKGFEYQPVRSKVRIEPGQREIKLEVKRLADFRSQGWVSADTHVHFISPTTALLEGQAEGLNLINLLAAQWGDLFTNVGDLTDSPLTTRDGEMMVWVGTENRQHILGHLGLLGTRGAVYPMSASGPEESYLGDPLRSTLAEWADACRQREGLVVAAHFPYPTAELAADIVLGKIDAVEMWPMGGPGGPQAYFNNLRFLDWYRYLNCGYRLPAVGGTDKMGAYMPAGTNRAYVHLGKEEFTFANWAKAVRSGNTFVTSGPLLLFQADGHAPGEEITLGAGGGTVDVHAQAVSFVPFHRLEIVMNGRVVASREESSGTREMSLRESVHVAGPGWLAARCSSRLGPVTWWQFAVQAHTSPVYLTIPGQELLSEAAATYMLTLIDGAQTWAETLATRPDEERLKQVRRVFEDARAELHRRLHASGVGH